MVKESAAWMDLDFEIDLRVALCGAYVAKHAGKVKEQEVRSFFNAPIRQLPLTKRSLKDPVREGSFLDCLREARYYDEYMVVTDFEPLSRETILLGSMLAFLVIGIATTLPVRSFDQAVYDCYQAALLPGDAKYDLRFELAFKVDSALVRELVSVGEGLNSARM